MTDENICADCGQRSDEEFCPLCDGKMTKIDDGGLDDFSYMSDEDDGDDSPAGYGYEGGISKIV